MSIFYRLKFEESAVGLWLADGKEQTEAAADAVPASALPL